ncbi:hypothetical protein VIBNISOn1_p0038 [Vibrio nigripulchritudo SOn1]|uniref:Uncharacterized protein n=1 Tax=Vibrio nigripulchritudo SOn1 TaxID=1238450 RepID=A0AAV2VZK9_9VIBR|nr:hypothetical protein VIBNISOn1_p0038 [Vibrio nigripulchritudo SOn1]
MTRTIDVNKTALTPSEYLDIFLFISSDNSAAAIIFPEHLDLRILLFFLFNFNSYIIFISIPMKIINAKKIKLTMIYPVV